MSSAISTNGEVRLKPDATGSRQSADSGRGVRLQPDHADGLQPWQFFVLGALGCATAVTFMARGRDVTSIVLLSVLMASTALVGMAALRALRPLVSGEEDRTVMIGARTRVALEREKMLSLRAIKELEFDRAMGKLSDEDFREMSSRLRARAARLIKQLDAGSTYREQIERDVAKRLGGDARQKPSRSEEGARSNVEEGAGVSGTTATALAERVCTQCSTANDHDARFCKNCGGRL